MVTTPVSCLENSTARGAWWATVGGVKGIKNDWATNTLIDINKVLQGTTWNMLKSQECLYWKKLSWIPATKNLACLWRGQLHQDLSSSKSNRRSNCLSFQSRCGSDGKESTWNARERHNAGYPGSIPGLGRSPEERNGNSLQYSCLENPMDGRAWQAIVHRVAKSRTQLKQLSTHITS